jgi:hypothetical protein
MFKQSMKSLFEDFYADKVAEEQLKTNCTNKCASRHTFARSVGYNDFG